MGVGEAKAGGGKPEGKGEQSDNPGGREAGKRPAGTSTRAGGLGPPWRHRPKY